MIEILDEKYPFASDPGNRYEPVYTPDIQPDGTVELVQTGVEDLWELHNAARDSCDVNVLAQKFLEGDADAFNRANPMFLDLLGAPKTLAEAYAINFRAQHAFELLPADVKERFGNSFMQFLEGAGTPEWFDLLKMQPKTEDVKESDTPSA